MNLTDEQKGYIKKNIGEVPIEKISEAIKVDIKDISIYIEKKFGSKKAEKLLSEKQPLISLHPVSDKNWFKQNIYYLMALLFIVILAYANSLNNAFVSDDIAEIVQNPSVGNIGVIASHPFGFIRPVLYWLAFNIGGLNPVFFRLINLFFHTGSVLSAFFLVKAIWNNKRMAFFSATLLAVHPVLTEPVIWISGGSYQQYTFFFLCSLLLYIHAHKERFRKSLYFCSILFMLFSFMSHPVMPGALFLSFFVYEVCFGKLKRNWLKIIPFIILTFIYVLVNLAALPERENTLQQVHYQEKGMDNLFVTVPIAIGSYFQLFVWPQDLTLYHSELDFSATGIALLYAIAIIYIAALIASYIKNKAVFFWLSLFIIALAPTLTPFRLNWIVAERYLYLPSLGIFAVAGYFLEKWANYKNLKPVVYTIFAIVVCLFIARTIVRNMDWKTDISLWFATGKTSPSSPNNHNNLGDAWGRLGDKQKALREFQTAIVLKPNYGDAYHNLANTYRELNQLDKAIENYQNAIKYNPNLWQSYQNIGAIYFQEKKYDLALENIQKAIQVNPKNLNLFISLGVIYLGMGDKQSLNSLLRSEYKQKAKDAFNIILSADPANQIAKQGLDEANKL